MSWNYRIIKRTFKTPADYEETQLAIYEVYYDNDGKVTAWSADPTYIVGETLEQLKDDWKRYSKAFDRPVLDWDELEKECEGQ